MENMPLLILLGIGGLLVIIVILFVVAQKKQDKTDASDTEEMLKDLEIDLKDATDDIDDTADVAEKPTQDLKEETKAVPDKQPEAADETKKSRSKKDRRKERRKDRQKDVQPEEPTVEEAPVEESTDFESTGEGEIGQIENLSGVALDEGQPDEMVQEVVEIEEEPVTLDDLSIADELNAVVAEPGMVPASDSVDPSAPTDTDDIVDIFETGEEDMSELDALFGASTDVEEHVMSGMESDSEDFLEDLQDDDFLMSAPKEPKSVEYNQESEPLRAIEPKAKPKPEPKPEPPPPPPKPAEPDPEDQKRHDKAKRIARVIVNDIRNYNPDKLAEGIQMGNIMKTLGKEVERGRLLYVKRVPQEITRETNYYREALIKILADGQPDLLGL